LAFETENAALAAKMISDAQIAELERVVELMKGETPVVADGDDSDHKFHLLIAAATGNHANVYILEELWRIRTGVEAVRCVYAAVCEKSTEHRFEEHNKIFEAIRDRNPERARQAMKGHFARLIEALLDASEQQAIDEVRRRSRSNRERYLKAASTV
jgi:DNA-binding FadR family transcriptional regulator